MAYTEILGYIACCLVLTGSCMPSMIRLRILAILSNLAFIGYAFLEGLAPVLLLNTLLLPVNIYRLDQATRGILATTKQMIGAKRSQ